MLVKHIDHLGEVGEAARQPIDLVDHNDVDQAALDIGQQPLQRRPVGIAAGVAGVVVVIGDRNPALGALAGNVSMTRLLLCVDGIEFLVEAFV